MPEERKVYGLVSYLPLIRVGTHGLALEQTFTDQEKATAAYNLCVEKNPGIAIWLFEHASEGQMVPIYYSKSTDEEAIDDSIDAMDEEGYLQIAEQLTQFWQETNSQEKPESL